MKKLATTLLVATVLSLLGSWAERAEASCAEPAATSCEPPDPDGPVNPTERAGALKTRGGQRP